MSKLPLRTLIAYGMPGLPLAVLTLPVYIFIPTLYTQELGLSLAAVGIILLVSRIVDAVSDPVIGLLSDRTAGRFGRRKPWVILATPLTMLSVYMLFVPPSDADTNYLLLWSIVLTLSWTMMLLPYSAWGAELSPDYHTRTRITAMREALVLLGTMAATAMPAILIQMDFPALSTHTAVIAATVLVLLPLTVLWTALAVPDSEVPARTPQPPAGGSRGSILDNGPFLRLIAAYLINATANGLPATLFILFVTHVIGAGDSYGQLLFAYFLSGLLAIPIWMFVSFQFGKHRTWVVAMLWACAVFIWTPFVVGEGDVTLFLIISILSGIGVGADLVLPASMQADVVDLDRLERGEQRTGLFFALWGVATKLALALAAAIAFLTLSLVGFDATAEPVTGNTPFALQTLALLYAGLPVVLKLIATALMWSFPLDAARQREIRTRIDVPS